MYQKTFLIMVILCVLGDKGIFFHKDSKACDPEGIYVHQYPRW